MKLGVHTRLALQMVVTPFLGVWIEIHPTSADSVIDRSLPSWECGLKSMKKGTKIMPANVTPFLGVWIEIKSNAQVFDKEKSLPSWECGLKSSNIVNTRDAYIVTPFLGVWIEISLYTCILPMGKGHSLLGSVD